MLSFTATEKSLHVPQCDFVYINVPRNDFRSRDVLLWKRKGTAERREVRPNFEKHLQIFCLSPLLSNTKVVSEINRMQ